MNRIGANKIQNATEKLHTPHKNLQSWPYIWGSYPFVVRHCILYFNSMTKKETHTHTTQNQ